MTNRTTSTKRTKRTAPKTTTASYPTNNHPTDAVDISPHCEPNAAVIHHAQIRRLVEQVTSAELVPMTLEYATRYAAATTAEVLELCPVAVRREAKAARKAGGADSWPGRLEAAVLRALMLPCGKHPDGRPCFATDAVELNGAIGKLARRWPEVPRRAIIDRLGDLSDIAADAVDEAKERSERAMRWFDVAIDEHDLEQEEQDKRATAAA